jgi:integrase
MPRIDTKRGRDALPPQRDPHYTRLGQGRFLGYRKTPDGHQSWTARYRDDAGKQHYTSLGELTDTFGFDEARAAADAWFADRERGVDQRDVDGKAYTVEAACRAYVEDRRRQKGEGAANDAHRRFERTVYGGGGSAGDRHKPHPIAGKPLAKVRRRMISDWRDDLVAGGLSKASTNRTMTALKAALNLAVRDRRVGADLAIEWGGVQAFKGASKRRDLYLDREQRAALVDAATGAVRDLIEAAALTGARPGELVAARRSAFDERTQSLSLSGKTGARVVPLAPAAVALFARLSKGKLPSAYLLTRDDGKPWSHSDWDELVREAAANARVGEGDYAKPLPAGVCLYTLRHSWITAALLGGISPLEVARMVGTSLTMIDRNYGHLAVATARERLAKVSML